MPERIKVVSANMLFIAKEGLPDALINRLVRCAAFQNPEFYQAQSLRLSTFGKPRIIGCAEDFPNHLARSCVTSGLSNPEASQIGRSKFKSWTPMKRSKPASMLALQPADIK